MRGRNREWDLNREWTQMDANNEKFEGVTEKA
jgi:hypothetical protein